MWFLRQSPRKDDRLHNEVSWLASHILTMETLNVFKTVQDIPQTGKQGKVSRLLGPGYPVIDLDFCFGCPPKQRFPFCLRFHWGLLDVGYSEHGSSSSSSASTMPLGHPEA